MSGCVILTHPDIDQIAYTDARKKYQKKCVYKYS